MSSRHYLGLFAVWLVLVGATAWFGMGSYVLMMMLAIPGFWVGGPLLLFTVLVGLTRLRSHGLAGFKLAAWVLGVLMTMMLAVDLGSHLCEWEIRRAKAAGPAIADKITAFHDEHGRWPESLTELREPLPRLLGYSSHSHGFSLKLNDPRYLFGGWTYNPVTGEWNYND